MTKRRAKGEGSVYRRKDGRVVGEYEDANGRKRYITSTTKTKQEMKAAVRKALEDRDKGIAYDSENLTVEKYLDHWLEAIRAKVRLGTFKPYEAIVRLHVKPTLGRTKLDKLNAMQLERLYRQKLDEGLSARRVRYRVFGPRRRLWLLISYCISYALINPVVRLVSKVSRHVNGKHGRSIYA